MNMISSTTGGMPKGKEIAKLSSRGSNDALYHAIQSASNVDIDDQHLVASDPYHLPYWTDSHIPNMDYLL